MFKKILVPLDSSELAERALHPAITLAQQADGEVVLLSVPVLKHMFVVESAGYGVLLPSDSLADSRQELTEYLETVTDKLPNHDFALRTKVVDGDEASVIVETAVAENVDLIVMSTHGYSGFTRWMLGSVAEKVLRSAQCPVLVVRSDEPISKILITLDGSELAEHSLKPGLEMARLTDSRTTLLRVAHSLGAHMPKLGHFRRQTTDAVIDEADVRMQIYNDARDYLQRQADKCRQSGQSVLTAVTFGPAAEEILDFAEQNKFDLIVMTTHGRTGLSHWVYGSVTEKVMRGAHCAVLIVRPPAHELN